ncbi:MAG: LuxR C-terminal-related transcriptional regulator [Dysgonomonas sp.]
MARITTYLILICGILILHSCNFHREDPEEVLSNVEGLMVQHPDSALRLLDKILSPQAFSEEMYHKYILLNMQARDKNAKDLSKDTLIFKTKDYYVAKNDIKNAALASFYASRVLQTDDEKERNEAITYLKDAETYTKNSSDYNLRGLIQHDLGELLLKQTSKDEPIPRFKQAVQYFDIADAYKNEIIAYNQIGRTFYVNRENDSAFFYYDKALSLAVLHKDTLQQALIKLNMGFAFMNAGDKNLARVYYKEALPFFQDLEYRVKTFTNIAYTFDSQTEKDSIMYYVDLARDLLKEKSDPSLMASIYKLLYSVEENNKNYSQAIAYQRQYIIELNKFFREKKSQDILDIQNKYDYAVIKSDNDRLIIEKQWWYLIAISLFAAVLMIGLAFYRYRIKNKEKLLDAQQKILHLKDLANSYDEKGISQRNVLLEHFDILKKVALLEGYMKDDEKKQGEKLLKKFNEIVYNQDSVDWSKIFQTLNHLSNNFPNKMKKAYPQLDDAEFKICCLTEAGLANMEIAIILGFSVNTVQMKKSNIRKKLNIEGYGNIIEYLKKNLN